MRYRVQPLGQFIDIISGYAFKSKDFKSTGIPVIKIKNVTPPEVSLVDLSYIPIEIADSLPKFELSYGDVLIALTGSHINQMASVVGRVARVKYYIRSMLNQRVGKIVVKDKDVCDLEYVYYYLSQDQVKISLASKAGGAANQANISLTDVKELEIPLPPIEIQRRISDILSAYDDLIENNQKQIKLLEEAAMRLYKEWFVKLRFPGHEKTKIEDGVPEGWEKLYIEDVCQTVGGGTPSTKVPSYYNNGTIPWVTPTDITRNDCLILLDTEKKITEEGLARSSAKMLPSETILMTSRASVGFFGISEQEVCTNQGFISCIPNNKNLMMFLLLNLMSRKDEIRQKAGGATYLEINKSTFRKLIVIKPDDTLLNEFQSITYTILKRISALKKQSDLLKQARDKLLPKLMNGEIEI